MEEIAFGVGCVDRLIGSVFVMILLDIQMDLGDAEIQGRKSLRSGLTSYQSRDMQTSSDRLVMFAKQMAVFRDACSEIYSWDKICQFDWDRSGYEAFCVPFDVQKSQALLIYFGSFSVYVQDQARLEGMVALIVVPYLSLPDA